MQAQRPRQRLFQRSFGKVQSRRSPCPSPDPSAWTERTGEGEFRQPWTSRDLRESHSHLSSASIHPFPLWDYKQVVSFTLHRRKVGNNWVHILKTPKTLGTNSSVLVSASPSPGGTERSFSPSAVMTKKKLAPWIRLGKWLN